MVSTTSVISEKLILNADRTVFCGPASGLFAMYIFQEETASEKAITSQCGDYFLFDCTIHTRSSNILHNQVAYRIAAYFQFHQRLAIIIYVVSK